MSLILLSPPMPKAVETGLLVFKFAEQIRYFGRTPLPNMTLVIVALPAPSEAENPIGPTTRVRVNTIIKSNRKIVTNPPTPTHASTPTVKTSNPTQTWSRIKHGHQLPSPPQKKRHKTTMLLRQHRKKIATPQLNRERGKEYHIHLALGQSYRVHRHSWRRFTTIIRGALARPRSNASRTVILTTSTLITTTRKTTVTARIAMPAKRTSPQLTLRRRRTLVSRRQTRITSLRPRSASFPQFLYALYLP